MASPVTVGYNNFKWLENSGESYGISLFRTDYTYGTFSMGKSDGTAFQIPSGHKMIILKMTWIVNAGLGAISEIQIHDSASANSASGTLLLDSRIYNDDAGQTDIDTYIEIASSRYINVTVPDPKNIFVNMLGVITDN